MKIELKHEPIDGQRRKCVYVDGKLVGRILAYMGLNPFTYDIAFKSMHNDYRDLPKETIDLAKSRYKKMHCRVAYLKWFMLNSFNGKKLKNKSDTASVQKTGEAWIEI